MVNNMNELDIVIEENGQLIFGSGLAFHSFLRSAKSMFDFACQLKEARLIIHDRVRRPKLQLDVSHSVTTSV